MIISNKQTAVEWLVNQLNKQGFAQVVTDEEIQQAKEMEQKQIENAFDDGEMNRDGNKYSSDYYNETFG
jgi:excinuclease UvrABC ATPase subunit